MKSTLILSLVTILTLTCCEQKSKIQGFWYACDKLGGGHIEMHIDGDRMLTYHYGIERLEVIPNKFKISNDTIYYHMFDPNDPNAGRALINTTDSIFSMTTITGDSTSKLPTRYKRIPFDMEYEQNSYYQDQPQTKIAFAVDFAERASLLRSTCLDQHLIKTHFEVFWEKFAYHELRIRNREEGHRENLEYWLKTIHPDLNFELQGDSLNSELIFTSSGEQTNIPNILIRTAPELENWTFSKE